jgi:LAO/AO transport system kinase
MVAVDPTSPISGGAVLGDRIRMGELATDDGVFIRSLASRGSFGGLSLAAGRVADVLDAFGCELILFETVGMGQVGDDIREQASTTVVVLVPESGDGIQVMKAGILELADIVVVNKSDRPGASDLLRWLQNLPAGAGGDWRPPVLSTCAQDGEGITDLWAAIEKHRAFRRQTEAPEEHSRRFWHQRFMRLAQGYIFRDFQNSLDADAKLPAEVGEVLAGRKSLRKLLTETVERFYRRQGHR